MTNISKLSSAVDKSVNQSTYLSLSGTLLSIRFGLTNMSSTKIIENILAGLPMVFEKLQFGFGSVNSIHLKSSDSPALPIHYSHQNEISEFLKTKVHSNKNEKKNESKKGQKGNKKQSPVAATSVATEDIDAPLPSAAVVGKKNKKTNKSQDEPAPAIQTIKPFSSPTTKTP